MIDPDNTYFFSDPHFDHTNIIKYCDRPFRDATEMNDFILTRYHETVRPDSTVFFLGDMSFGRDSRPPKYWLSQLCGNIIYIKGSHDHGIRPTNTPNCYHRYDLRTDKGTVMLVHNPGDIPYDWHSWTIHGHTHSNIMVDHERKRVCVCVEATNYYPVSLSYVRESICLPNYDPLEVERMFACEVGKRISRLKRDHYDPDIDG